MTSKCENLIPKKKWDKLQVVRAMVKMDSVTSDFPVAFSLLCDEIRTLKNKVKDLEERWRP